ncbi:MAG: anti-CBASS protein Acb1 family protein [Catonella sp.]
MDEKQKVLFQEQMVNQRGAAIIDGKNNGYRADGYSNMLNKVGTKQDNSTSYQYSAEPFVTDMELSRLYEGNGLFSKIINRPAEEAVKHGLDIDFGDEDISEYIEEELDELSWENRFATAEKWARLYGGAIIVMLVDDGRGLEEPLDWDNVKSFKELRVYDRSIVQPDYFGLYGVQNYNNIDFNPSIGEPEYYQVFSIYGYFVVHKSRCLVFKNGELPEQTTSALYRFWGIPEYIKIRRSLRECITSHEDGVKLLERCVQAIYKMKNLSQLLSTDEGEDKVLQRLQVIDMARGILNSIAIDNDGEDYDYKQQSLSGVKEIIDSTCNMLSAVTDIPQTILFGRSPAGENSTGESDQENYYNMVENIQKQNMKRNARTIIDLKLIEGLRNGKIKEKPKYKVKFAALWSMSEKEKAEIEKLKADTEYVKAQTATLYMDSGVVDASEVRRNLAKEGEFQIEELIMEDDLDISGLIKEPAKENVADITDSENIDKVKIKLSDEITAADSDDIDTVAVIVVKDGKILCGKRRDGKGLCGPGGHIESGETPDNAIIREALEEFNIIPLSFIPIGTQTSSTGLYHTTKIYLAPDFYGELKADGEEMLDEEWLSISELNKRELFKPFADSIDLLLDVLTRGFDYGE